MRPYEATDLPEATMDRANLPRPNPLAHCRRGRIAR
jgi:hypothetical protein